MSIAVGLWSVIVSPGQELEIVPQSDLRITNVALDETLQDPNGRSTVTLSYLPMSAFAMNSDDEDEEEAEPKDPSEEIKTAVLCSLTGGRIESTTVDIVLEEQTEYILQVTGKNAVHLLGNYIDQQPINMPPYGDSDEESDDDDAYDLRDVSSDVVMDPEDELDSDADRFEEIIEKESKKTSKRARPSEEVDTETVAKVSKKAAKKQKGADGAAVAAPTEKAEKADKKEKKDKPVERTLPGGLKTKDAALGDGPQAKKGNTVSMRYIGKLDNGKVFDSNTKGKPFTFKLGAGEVIKGWDEGIVGMKPGSERVLVVPAGMAYGKKKMGDIPANSTLTFEVKLLEIKK